MDTELLHLLVEASTSANTKTTKRMDKELLHLLVEAITSANSKTTKGMDTELIHLLMETNNQGCGSMANSKGPRTEKIQNEGKYKHLHDDDFVD